MKVRIWCEIFYKAPQGGGKALRAMRACEKFGPSAEKLGSNPILGRFWHFLAVGKGIFYALNNTGSFLFKPLLRCGDPPCGIYTLDKIIR